MIFRRSILIIACLFFTINADAKVLHDRSYNVINPATSDNQDTVISELQTIGITDTTNSYSTNLGNGEVFTGEWKDNTGYAQVLIELTTDQDAATDGFIIQHSEDSLNVRHVHSISVKSNAPNGHHYPFSLTNKYYRIIYTNGTTPTGSFYLNSYLVKTPVEDGHTHSIEAEVDSDHPASINRSVIMAKNPGGAYGNINRTTGGNLKISMEEIESGISSNSNSQLNVTLFSETGIAANVDSMSASLQVVDFEHHECHEGNCYFSSFGNDVSGGGEQTCIALNTPATGPMIHMIFDASAGLEAFASIYENPSIDVDEGTQQNPFNRNRIVLNNSIVESIETSPVTDEVTTYNETQAAGANITTTTEIFHEHIGVTGAPTTRSGGISRGRSEYILARSQQYAFCITAIDVNANHHNVRLNWYEHTDSNP